MEKICYLVPAHNEELVISKTLESLLKLSPAEDIYVVDDGSKDGTSKVAKSYVPNVLTLEQNVGKATATNVAIKHFGLTKKYMFIMPMDADTIVTPKFIDNTLPILEQDKEVKIACVVGRVAGKNHNWITTYRIWEYEIAQAIHKSAQQSIGAVIVCPGCSTIYRSEVFNKIQIPTGTLTEDMDLTFKIHRSKAGKIVFTNKAVVVTQDPNNLKDFLKQIDRWYTGFWQCVVKHDIPWQGQVLDLEVGLLALEGLFNGILALGFLFLIPYALVNQPSLLIYPLTLDLGLFVLPTFVLVAVKYRLWKIFLYLPLFYLVRMLSSFMFFRSFFKVVFAIDQQMKWGKANRYQTI